jgi:hypothetical protein
MVKNKLPPPVKDGLRNLLRDPKWTSVMAVLSVTASLLLLRLGSDGPAAASAYAPRLSTARVHEFHPALQPVARGNALLDWLSQPRRQIERNIFSLEPDSDCPATTRGDKPDSPNESDNSSTKLSD